MLIADVDRSRSNGMFQKLRRSKSINQYRTMKHVDGYYLKFEIFVSKLILFRWSISFNGDGLDHLVFLCPLMLSMSWSLNRNDDYACRNDSILFLFLVVVFFFCTFWAWWWFDDHVISKCNLYAVGISTKIQITSDEICSGNRTVLNLLLRIIAQKKRNNKKNIINK